MGEELGTILESQIPEFLVMLGKTVAETSLSFTQWNLENPDGVRKAAASFIAMQ